jgi:hypothetical protein
MVQGVLVTSHLKKYLPLFLLFQLCVGVFSPTVLALSENTVNSSSPSIGEFQSPSLVYPEVYFTLNCTILDSAGSTNLVTATLMISNETFLKWDASKGFSINNQEYCNLDDLHSYQLTINSTAIKLVFSISLSTDISQKEIIATVFNKQGMTATVSFMGSASLYTDYEFTFDAANSTVDTLTTFKGSIFYDNTSIPYGDATAVTLNSTSVNYGHSSSLFWKNEGTIALWAKIMPNHWWQFILNKQGYDLSSVNEGFSLHVTHYDLLYFNIVTNAGSWSCGGFPVDGTFHFIVVTWGNNEMKMFVDGKQYGSTVMTKGEISVGQDYPLYIGARQRNYGFSACQLDEVRVYNRCLDSGEVTFLAQSLHMSDLVLYLPLNGAFTDESIVKNPSFISGPGVTWSSGYIVLPVTLTFNGTSVSGICIVNSMDGSYTIYSNIKTSDFEAGHYEVTIEFINFAYSTHIFYEYLKIVDCGVSHETLYLGDAATVWYKLVYASDLSEFNGDSGQLSVNNVALTWSSVNDRWEYNFTANAPKAEQFVITGVHDRIYDISVVSASIPVDLSVVALERIYPIPWLILGLFLAILFYSVFTKMNTKILDRVLKH